MNWRILLLTVPLVAMSCAGPAAPEPAGSASVTEESVTEEPAEERPEEGAFDAWPIDALSDSEAGISESEIVEFEEIEQLIGECMRAQGFEYSPIDIREITTTFDPTDPWGGLHYGSEEWIAKFGFGVTTLTSLEKIEAHQAERDDPDNLSPQEAYFASLND